MRRLRTVRDRPDQLAVTTGTAGYHDALQVNDDWDNDAIVNANFDFHHGLAVTFS